MLRKPSGINKLRALVFWGAALTGISSLLLARTINVPADFSTIQAAINAAVAGDVVSVAAGTYDENLTFKSGVSVIGAGSTVTFVDGGRRGSVGQLINCDSNTRVSGFTFRNGDAEFGGGLYISGGAPVITLNRITGNTAVSAPSAYYYYYGGGLEVSNSNAVITDNDIDANTADFGAGLDLWRGKPILTLNRISGNTAGSPSATYTYGGGVATFYTDAVITDNTFTSNKANTGAGLDITAGSPQVLRNRFSLNVAGEAGGGMSIQGPGTPLISDNLVAANRAIRQGSVSSLGGGVQVLFSNASLFNNTIVNNEADFGGGVRIRTSGGPVALTNNILYGNVARAAGTQSGAALLDGGGLQVDHNIFSQNTPSNCGGGSATLCMDTSNILLDPLFVNTAGGDYRLRAGSPAIDSALDSVAPRDDIRGQRRPLDGNRDGVAIADRGAYEFDRDDVFNLRFLNALTITWDAAQGATEYHFYSGGIATLGSQGIDTCRDADDSNRGDLLFTETLSPAAGAGFAYLVTAVVGTERTPGWGSLGLERFLPAPCP